MGNQPINIFKSWLIVEMQLSNREAAMTCCLSTIGLDGYPNARFVALKDINDDHLIITGPLKSRKGIEISYQNRVAITFWWPETKRQVRFQGDAFLLEENLSNKIFLDRPRDSQITSIISQQGHILDSMEELEKNHSKLFEDKSLKTFSKPADWGGYKVKPHRVELFEFKISRLHTRTMFYYENDKWFKMYLQP